MIKSIVWGLVALLNLFKVGIAEYDKSKCRVLSLSNRWRPIRVGLEYSGLERVDIAIQNRLVDELAPGVAPLHQSTLQVRELGDPVLFDRQCKLNVFGKYVRFDHSIANV